MNYILTYVNQLEQTPKWRITKVKENEPELEDIQKEVGGYLELINVFPQLEQKNINCLVNENGKYKGYPPTLAICNENKDVLDVVVGNICFLKYDENGDLFALDKENVNHPPLRT